MDIALHLTRFDVPGGPQALPSVLTATARAADEAGFSALTLMDHWFQMEQPGTTAYDPMLEGYTTLGFLAAQTRHLSLGLLVTGVTYRHPGLLAKTVSTLDVLSGGRAMLGIGAAWYEREHHGLGVPFPPVPERFERLEETLQICRQMWSDDTGPYIGHHYRLAETICSPAPEQQAGLPIAIGGMGEKKTLRLVARYADACNLFAFDPGEVAHKLDVLNRPLRHRGTGPRRDQEDHHRALRPPRRHRRLPGRHAGVRRTRRPTGLGQPLRPRPRRLDSPRRRAGPAQAPGSVNRLPDEGVGQAPPAPVRHWQPDGASAVSRSQGRDVTAEGVWAARRCRSVRRSSHRPCGPCPRPGPGWRGCPTRPC